jgi:protein-tyrosine phosphatase
VLFVCTGNLCRSPLAAALFQRELTSAGIDAEITSVGLAAPIGMSPDRKLRRVAGELGVDVSSHRSTPITSAHLRRADLVLTMTSEQAQEVRRLDAGSAERCTTLRAAAWKARIIAGRPLPIDRWVERLVADAPPAERATNDAAYDIPDPIGGPLRQYRAMGDEVRALVVALVERWSGR